ncbi:MAG: protein-glutamate O-methyltransferase CheR [Hyphomicrobium sp.]
MAILKHGLHGMGRPATPAPVKRIASVFDAPAGSFPHPWGSLPALTDDQFDYFRGLAMRHAGIVIAGFKRSMLLRRIRTRMSALMMDTAEDYCRFLASPDGEGELQPLINALTTNKTEFFREKHHFDHLASVVLPRLVKEKAKENRPRLRIWSAGCSTGEEPYSIAMTLSRTIESLSEWNARILATDIDTEVLDRARQGHYRLGDVTPVSPELRHRYLEAGPAGQGWIRVVPSIQRLVTFKPLNLHHEWPMRGPFDVIFCRNVVIYFDKATQRLLFNRFADLLTPGGILYCGHSESLFGICPRFRPLGQSIYQRIE